VPEPNSDAVVIFWQLDGDSKAREEWKPRAGRRNTIRSGG